MHQFYKKKDQGAWLTKLIRKMMKPFSPVGTIGPIPYLECQSGPNRKERRANKARWRRYGEAATKISARRGISIDKALEIAMAGR